VGDLESLETVGSLSLLSDDIEDLVDELGSFGVVTLSPVVLRDGTKAISDEMKNVDDRFLYSHQHQTERGPYQDQISINGMSPCLTTIPLDSPTHMLSGLKRFPKGPLLIESMVPGSKSTRTARGTYLPKRQAISLGRPWTGMMKRKRNILLGGSLVEVDLDLIQLGLGLTNETTVKKGC
jgi:hypothetical protein